MKQDSMTDPAEIKRIVSVIMNKREKKAFRVERKK